MNVEQLVLLLGFIISSMFILGAVVITYLSDKLNKGD